MIKIGLLGNMNQNNFVLMRYLRDFGLDAHLIMYSNEFDHFLPENDTYNINKWKDYIHESNLSNGGKAGVIDLLINPEKIREQFSKYDIIISNGLSPALSFRIGKSLDLFIPYGNAIEYLLREKQRSLGYRGLKSFMASHFVNYFQYNGLKKNTKWILSFDTTEKNSKYYEPFVEKVQTIPLTAVYNEEFDNNKLPLDIQEKISLMKNYDVVFFSHVAHDWEKDKRPSSHVNNLRSNDKLIRAYSRFIKKTPLKSYILFLFDYGVSAPASKKLVNELGISSQVFWCDKMPRKHIMALIQNSHLGIGECGGSLWGSTGWEFMSQGVPFIQNVDILPNTFEKTTGMKFPPLFNIKSEEDILDIFKKIDNDSINLKDKDKLHSDWYEKNGGQSLAKKYKKLLLEIINEKFNRS